MTRGTSWFFLIATVATATSCEGQNVVGAGQDVWQERRASGATIWFTARDAAFASTFESHIVNGLDLVAGFFGSRAADGVTARLLPDRAALTAHWRREWRQPALETACWMIAAGWATELDLLSPRAWPADACGHDGNDRHVSLIVAHELVHVFHARQNTRYTAASTQNNWLTEGLAVYASGQLTAEYLPGAQQRVREGFTPTRLVDFAGQYGLAGSLWRFVDEKFGRPTTLRLLAATTPAEFVATLQVEEAELLSQWRVAMLTWPAASQNSR